MARQKKEDKQEEQSFDIYKSLDTWRVERNLPKNTRADFVKQVLEELLEMYGLDKKQVKQNTEVIYNTFFIHLEPREVSDEVLLDSSCDIQTFGINFNGLLGYNSEKCMEECFKHINCRKQDPKQKADWEKNKPNGKWKKWAEQPQEEIYEPNYESCKLEE